MSESAKAPFADSRRLTGHNRFFDGPGAVLETGVADAALIAAWEARVRRATRHLGWRDGPVVAAAHPAGASLALSAPPDRLFTATEVNEWALAASIAERDPSRSADLIAALAAEQPEETDPPALEGPAALGRLLARSKKEAKPRLVALIDEAARHGLPVYVDDEQLTIGAGSGGRTYRLDALPDAHAVPWPRLHPIPLALVTGTNGKTTIVRLIAACSAALCRVTGHSCTDGVFIGGQAIRTGDYSGPAGARALLRDARVECAVLETARGGILRRGLAVAHADAAVVTGVSADHFGEYGIHDLAGLVEVKLAVARALGPGGRLVLNAEDELLATQSQATGKSIGWFAQEAAHPRLAAHRRDGGATSGVAAGRLELHAGGRSHDLGPIASMPLTAGGQSAFNVMNLAAAALAAEALAIPPATIAGVFARFGADPMDNPGRLMRYELGGVRLIVDFAHNPAALARLLQFATAQRGAGRLALVLGQAGNRVDEDLGLLAATAAAARPDLVVIKELSAYRRGRGVGEVPAILRTALARTDLPATRVEDAQDELTAVRRLLAWARSGDVLVLPLHSREGRAEALALIARLARGGWVAGKRLPG